MSVFISIDGSRIKALLVNDSGLALLCGEVPIGNKEELSLSLKQLISGLVGPDFEKTKKSLQCYLNLPDSQTFVHYFHLPLTMPEANSHKEITDETARTIPFKLSDINCAYSVKKENDSYSVLIVAVLKTVIEGYKTAFSAAGLVLSAVDVESLSLGRSLINFSGMKEARMIANISQKSIGVCVFQNTGMLIFSSNMPFSDKKEEIAEEIKKRIVYCEKHLKVKVADMILAGDLSLIPEADKFFGATVGIPAFILDPWTAIKWVGQGTTDQKHELFADVIGLALREVNKLVPQINLFLGGSSVEPASIKKGFSRYFTKTVLISIVSGIILISIFYLLFFYAKN